MKPKISVIIPAYNSEKTIEKTLSSVRSQNFPGIEILVVDDRSTDMTVNIAKKHADRVLVNRQNRGPAFTRNRGIREAKSELIVFIDSDAYADKGWLKAMYTELMNGNADIIMGNVRISKSNMIGDSISALGFPGGGSIGFEKMWRVDKDGFTDHITSCNMGARKSVFQKHGFFDESFPLAGGEDSEFSFRLTRSGAKIRFCGDAVVYHEPRASIGSFVKWQIKRGESNIHFKRKVGNVNNFIGLRIWSSMNIIKTFWKDPKFPLIMSFLMLSFLLQGLGGASETLRRINFRSKDIILVSTMITFIMYLILFPYNSMFPDESSNLLLGRSMLDGIYRHDFLSRTPFLPSLATVMYASGFDSAHIRFILPLLFTILSVISVYLLAELVSGRKVALLSVVLLLSLPVFWRWAVRFLTDIPLLSFTAFSFYAYYLILKDGSSPRRWMILGTICALGTVTKISFLILPVVIVLHLLSRNRGLIPTKEFVSGVLTFLVLVSIFMIPPILMGSQSGLLGTLEGRVTGEEEFTLLRVINNRSIFFLDKYALFPVGLFALFAIPRFWKNDKLLIIFSLLVVAAYFLLWGIRPRYFSPVFPLLTMLAAGGFYWLRDRLPRIALLLFAVLLFLSFTNSIQFTAMDHRALYGVDDLGSSLNGINGIVASDYLPFYVNITNPVISETLPGETVADMNMMFYSDDSLTRIKDADADVVILSLYGDYVRSGRTETFPIFYGPFTIPIDRVYSNGRIPPEYSFESDLFKQFEEDNFELEQEVMVDGRVTFLIYRRI